MINIFSEDFKNVFEHLLVKYKDNLMSMEQLLRKINADEIILLLREKESILSLQTDVKKCHQEIDIDMNSCFKTKKATIQTLSNLKEKIIENSSKISIISELDSRLLLNNEAIETEPEKVDYVASIINSVKSINEERLKHSEVLFSTIDNICAMYNLF